MAPAAMFKLLSQTTVSEEDRVGALRDFGNKFGAGYTAAKGKIDAKKAKDQAEAEKAQARADKEKEASDKKNAEEQSKLDKNARIQDAVGSIYAYLPQPPLHDQELIDKNGIIKDSAWHQLNAEELAFLKKYTDRLVRTNKDFRIQLEKRLKTASFLDKTDRDSVHAGMSANPKDVDTQTHDNMNKRIEADIMAMYKSGNLKSGLDICINTIKDIADNARDKVTPGKAPLLVDRAIFMLGAVLNNYSDHLGVVQAAIESHEFSNVLDPKAAQEKSQEQEAGDQEAAKSKPPITASQTPPPQQAAPAEEPPVKEARRLVSFRPLTESEVF